MPSYGGFVADSSFLANHPLGTFPEHVSLAIILAINNRPYSSDMPYSDLRYVLSNVIIPTMTDVLMRGSLSWENAARHSKRSVGQYMSRKTNLQVGPRTTLAPCLPAICVNSYRKGD